MCGRYYIPEEDSAEDLRAIIDEVNRNHYGGNHRNMSVEEEARILAPFLERAAKGELVEVREIAAVYQAAVNHHVSNGQIVYAIQSVP